MKISSEATDDQHAWVALTILHRGYRLNPSRVNVVISVNKAGGFTTEIIPMAGKSDPIVISKI